MAPKPSSGLMLVDPIAAKVRIRTVVGLQSCHVLDFLSVCIDCLLLYIVSGYLQACKNAACSASDTVSAGQCKSFNNGMWAEWNCIDCAGK